LFSLFFRATLASELCAQARFSAFFCECPRAIRPRRIVAGVLPVSAFELSDPVAKFVLMKTDDAPFERHDPPSPMVRMGEIGPR